MKSPAFAIYQSFALALAPKEGHKKNQDGEKF
jgi:hypothetical protein